MKKEVITNNEFETTKAGLDLGLTLKPGAVVALYGDLGVGKTAFTRGVVKSFKLDELVYSPTFTIVNEYLGDIPVFHFDMYRLENEDDLFDIGWDDYLDRNGICVVEWSERIPGAFPPNTTKVTISRISDNQRKIVIDTNREKPICTF